MVLMIIITVINIFEVQDKVTKDGFPFQLDMVKCGTFDHYCYQPEILSTTIFIVLFFLLLCYILCMESYWS